MKYRQFDKLGVAPSALGFGCMRLPIIGDDFGNINEPEAIKMIRHAIDNGVNYVDTAYAYHRGNSEFVLGKALKDGYREKVMVADKLPIWEVKTEEDADRLLNEQLERVQVDYFDFYLLHALNGGFWKTVQKFDLIQWGEQKRKEGKIRFFGFSFHDDQNLFMEILDAHDWDFCQIQYNYMDEEHQAGRKGLDRAHEKGIAVIIMEPLRGGDLVKNLPEPIMDIINNHETKRSPVDWAFSWLWDQEKVWFVLSGMNTMQEVEEDIVFASAAETNSLSESDQEMIAKVRDLYCEMRPVPCTGCRYCLPCPVGISIPWILSIYNDWHSYKNEGKTSFALRMQPEGKRPMDCIECGKCSDACPQQIAIPNMMKEVAELYEKLGIK